MQPTQTSSIFNEEFASAYDRNFARFAPLRDAMQLLIRTVLSELPAEARILCVGVGTGSELISLAEHFPLWHFTGVEPAAPMLDICRQRIEEGGIASRCVLHEGYLDSLPASEPFHAATSILVSQFLMRTEDRREFFQQIAARLLPDGYLVSADLASDMSSSAYRSLLEVWSRMLQKPGMGAAYGRDVAVLPTAEIESIVASGGFETPVLFLQTLLIHAWYTRKTS